MKFSGKRRWRFLLGLGLSLWLAGGPPAVPAQDLLTVDENGMVSMDFDNVDVRIVIKYISDLTGKNFILDNDVRGPVTVISPTKIPLDEIYKVFESILEVRGFVAVPAGKVIKVSTKRKGSQRNIKLRVGDNLEQIVPEDTIVTQLIPLQYAEVEKIRNALGQLFSKDSSVIPYPTTNTLIVTDVSSNIRRLVKIIKELDIPGYETRITVTPLRYAAADTLAADISQVIEEVGKVPGSPPTPRRRAKGIIQSSEKLLKIIPDDRTNSLIILANDEDTKRVLDLVRRLDVETERTRIHVYFLKNSNAEDMAKVLNSIVSKRKPKGGESVPLISEDKPNNALIIDATQEDYASLSKIIQKLDIVRDQVLVEVLIAEVSYDETFELGVEWRSLEGFPNIENMQPGRENAEGFGEMLFGSGLKSYSSPTEGLASSGLAGASIGFVQRMAGSGTSIPDFGVLLHALSTNKNVNILATPQILTVDNEEAEIKVVRNIPYMSKIEIGAEGKQDYQNIEYKDVGIELKITPHISKEGMVRLEVEQKISTLAGGQEISGIRLTPETFDRQTKTSIIVKDNHTIVIGGLIRDDKTETESKVPILGDIPLLGLLFRTTSTRTQKINLLVFITPRVVRTTQQIADLTKMKRIQSPEIDDRLSGEEEALAEQEEEARREQEIGVESLRARYGTRFRVAIEESEPPTFAPKKEDQALPAERGEAGTGPVESETAAEAEKPVKEKAEKADRPTGSFLDSLPRVSFGKKDESQERQKGTGRFHR